MPTAKTAVHIHAVDVVVKPARLGFDLVVTDGTTQGYVIHLPWNGWLPHLMSGLSGVVREKVDLAG